MLKILTSAPFGMQVFLLIVVCIIWITTSSLIVYSNFLISRYLLKNDLDRHYLKLMLINYPLWLFLFMVVFFFLIRLNLVSIFRVDTDMSEFLGLIFGYLISTILTGILITRELVKKYHYKINRLGKFLQVYFPIILIPFLFPKVGTFFIQLISDILSTDFFPFPLF